MIRVNGLVLVRDVFGEEAADYLSIVVRVLQVRLVWLPAPGDALETRLLLLLIIVVEL